MDRVAVVSGLFFAALIAINGGLSTGKVAARKGYNPRQGALMGAISGFVITIAVTLALLALVPNHAGIGVLGGLIGGIGGLTLLWNRLPDKAHDTDILPGGEALKRNIAARHVQGSIARTLFILSIAVALIALAILVWTIINKSIGLTAVQYQIEPEELLVEGQPSGRPLDDLNEDELEVILADNARVARLRVFILRDVVRAAEDNWATLSPKLIEEVLKGKSYDESLAGTPLNQLDEVQAANILARNLSRNDLHDLVYTEIVKPEVVQGWSLWESLTNRSEIEAIQVEKYPLAHLKWRSWVNREFITSPLDPRTPDATGIRPALYGSLMIILITIVFAFPIGVGAAIYLEEYAGEGRINQIIQTNISNLAGVPSIIYGILGLAIFVRTLESLTSGAVFGVNTPNGRTVLSAGFTLALLILPMIIINAQEAIRAVPNSMRQASYGLGATQWQTIWNHVLPYAMPGILTGTILAISRAIGETAPLILVGGATFLTQDPKGPFSIFTALPLIIYRWTTLPQAEFRNAAAAAIIVLLVLLLTLNSIAVILRNRFSRRLS